MLKEMVERLEAVAGRVVARFVADRRDVERQPFALGEAVDVSVVGQEPVDVGPERIGDRVRDRTAENGDCGGIRVIGLEHVGRPAHAAREDTEAPMIAHEQLDDQARAKQFEGKQVQVTGSLDSSSQTIKVQDIKAAS